MPRLPAWIAPRVFRAALADLTAAIPRYSPFSLDIENPQIDLLKTCRELGVAVVAYSPIGRGMVTGQIKSRSDLEEGDFRLLSPRWSEENFPKNMKLVDQIGQLASKKGVTASQLTLAWLMAQGDDIFPMYVSLYLTSNGRLADCSIFATARAPPRSTGWMRTWVRSKSSCPRTRSRPSARRVKAPKSLAAVIRRPCRPPCLPTLRRSRPDFPTKPCS